MNAHVGEMLGEVYCGKFFPPESKTKCIEMIEFIRGSLKETIQNLEWMGNETKEKAMDKIGRMGVKVGYPDMWTDYSSLEISDDASYATNVLRSMAFEHKDQMRRVNKPVESHRWEMPCQVVNAYFHPLKNEIVFPAAILQAPAFDANRDDALNFGAIGAVIGHEMTHAFDDQGRNFDADGNMNDWWQEDDANRFKEMASLVVDQYAKYEVYGEKINGELTQGENIADIGGAKIAFRALQKSMREKGQSEEDKIDGFTQYQRFFLGWGQFWAAFSREKEALKLLAIDPHSPSTVRAFAPLKNLPEFYEAFGVKESDDMYLSPEKRLTLW